MRTSFPFLVLDILLSLEEQYFMAFVIISHVAFFF